MRVLILLPLMFCAAFGQAPAGSDSPVAVTQFGWTKDRKAVPKFDNSRTAPVREVHAMNKKFPRQAREQLSPGALDPNEQTIDGRSAALEKINEETRKAPGAPVDGYTYRAALRNDAEAAAEIVFIEFQFRELANPANFIRRQFVCSVKIKPNQTGEIEVFSTLGPSDVISFKSLGSEGKLFDEAAVVNRVEFRNGAVLQRKEWNFAEIKPSLDRAVSTPWGKEACRGL